MSSARVERRLAAILAADVVGYSRLMGVDEVGTLAALKAHRHEVVDPAISAHHGRIVKTTGDGMLVEFGSAVDAVNCAMTVQKAMSDRNQTNAKTNVVPNIVFRIGIFRASHAQKAFPIRSQKTQPGRACFRASSTHYFIARAVGPTRPSCRRLD